MGNTRNTREWGKYETEDHWETKKHFNMGKTRNTGELES